MSESVKGILLAAAGGIMFCLAVTFLMLEVTALKQANLAYRTRDAVVSEYGGEVP